MLFAIAVFCTTTIVIWYRSKALVTAAYYEGYRASVRDAVGVIVRTSQEEFARYEPGHIVEALNRTSLLGDVKDQVKDLAKQIGRPI